MLTTRKIHSKRYPQTEWCISMNTEDVISRFFKVCANSQFVYIIKRTLQGGLKIRIFIFC